ncbi:hypothetical protein [Phyllobacterium chamaecytisi]|uniref:hypothetical protein n=1 Tax=Phyllobacterium chamaecytisi TaxID=2876082 RepID=UPI001CCAF90F|nr:hypothetical protein [Phyllobacterium sp. KW56]MBZ9605018.1 hypothetical protein [Phyllobacterium sp. KW56]
MSQNAELLAEIGRRAERAKAAHLNIRHMSKEAEDIHTQFPHRCEEYIKAKLEEALRKNGMGWNPE